MCNNIQLKNFYPANTKRYLVGFLRASKLRFSFVKEK